jgi:DNA repair exonuclease SbcCD ATPase subunit
MWYLKELEIDGLMSFASAKLDFSQGEVSVIYGKNLDAGEDKSNGSGKSAILEGIGFGITGSPLRKVKISELVNDDAKQAFVKIVLANDGLGEVMEIHRVFFRRKSAVCQVFVGDGVSDPVQIDKLTSTNEANKYISDKIGILPEDLLNYFILMSAKFTPFLDASDTKKKEVINRFSNGIIVDKAIEELQLDIDEETEEFNKLDLKSNNLISNIEVLESTLHETLNRVDDDDKAEGIREYEKLSQLSKSKIEELRDEIKEDNLDLKDVIEEIEESPSTEKLDKDLEKLEFEIGKQKELRLKLKKDLQEIDHKMNHLKLKIEGSLDCPKCGHEFDPTDEGFNIKSETERYHKELTPQREDIIERGKAVRQGIDAYQIKIDSFTTRIAKITGTLSGLNEEKSDIERSIRKNELNIQSYENKIVSYGLKIEALSAKDEVDVVTPLKNRIAATQAEYEPVRESMVQIESTMDQLNVQMDVFKRFKSHLANLSLKSMEGLANDFLHDFGSDIFIQLNSDKKLANGKTREKIDSTLVRNGVDIGSFNKRSGGEKAAINLAFAKTLSHLINLNAGENKGLNLLVIDEILDSTDAEGMTKIVRALENAGETAILITHIPLPASVGKSITVVKENDISRIYEV